MRSLASFALLMVFGIGCGGVVVFDDGSNSGGAGGAGGTGPVGPVGPGSTSTGIFDVCESLCALPGSCFGDPSTCRQSCQGVFIQGCEKEATAYLGCVAQTIDTNNCEAPPDACAFEANAYVMCANQGQCTTDACDGGGGGDCYCSGSCNGSLAEVKCGVIEGGNSCSCILDGQFYGNCQDFSENSCALETSCCIDLFFGIEPQPG